MKQLSGVIEIYLKDRLLEVHMFPKDGYKPGRNAPSPSQETPVPPKSSCQNIFLPPATKKTIKPAVQPTLGDYWFPGPAACPPMWHFLSLLYK
jgi:hypothetical protein